MSTDFCWVLNGGEKNSIKEGKSNRKLFPHHAFFFHPFCFDSGVHFLFLFERFCSSPIRIFWLLSNKNSKFKTEKTGVMKTHLYTEHCLFISRILLWKSFSQHKFWTPHTWLLLLGDVSAGGEPNFSAYQILTRLKFNEYQILAST